METQTIKIKTIKVKKQTDTYTIYEIETEAGVKLDTFDVLKEGEEVKGTITPNAKNPKYNALFKKEKPEGSKRTFTPKDWTSEKKMCCLNNAVILCIHDKIKLEQIPAVMDKLFIHLNKK